MLRPSLIVDTVVSALRSIPDLVSAMANDPARIKAFHFIPGVEKSLAAAVNTMLQPSMLVTWAGTMGGNFDGAVLWKHQIDIYFRTANQANVVPALAFEDVWWLATGKPIFASADPYHNIRNVELLPGQLSLMELPTVTHMTDAEGQDYFLGHCVFPEWGDQL